LQIAELGIIINPSTHVTNEREFNKMLRRIPILAALAVARRELGVRE